ncbi:hypothetical protein ACPPVO_34675 [Dactylosporangium sp. McL0621]|uniref:hypothetical protein n=1 Tax=Dactylosporangium sp. McL0621 TaxID=3415678 RepID=UPI003CEC0E09
MLAHISTQGQRPLWAQQVFAGEERPGHWGRYRPVLPQGTGPLQAAAFAAAMLGDAELAGFLAARIENEEPDEHRFDEFLADIRRFYPHRHHRHVIGPAQQ